MAFCLPVSIQIGGPKTFLYSDLLPARPFWKSNTCKIDCKVRKKRENLSFSVTCSAIKHVPHRSLDKHVVKQNRIRFVLKLKTLLLSKPKHYMPIHLLYKCRSYLSLSKPRSILSMIHRYPTIFELFAIPRPQTPMNATKSLSQLCVRLTPAAASLVAQESNLKSAMSTSLAIKLQKLLMISSHHRLLLSKLVHLAPDLGLPPNFRSRLRNDHPDKFKTVNTSYGRALDLVSWDSNLASPLPSPEVRRQGLLVDRPLKFKYLRLRKGLNVKRCHQEFLIKFGELPEVCPYKTKVGELAKESIEAEKRACAVAREVLGMMVEKRTLIDHLTHFRKEFGLSNKLRAMLLRHPELFYVSLKGQRDSVFLVEAYDDKGALLEKDETSMIKDHLIELVKEGKRMRRERRKGGPVDDADECEKEYNSDDDSVEDIDYADYDDGLDDLFESEYSDAENEYDDENDELLAVGEERAFWTAEASSLLQTEGVVHLQPW